MSLSLGTQPARRRLSLTPLIDVVFLLLVFFMLAARFGAEAPIRLGTTGGGASYSGPPRLVQITEDALSLNGEALSLGALNAALEGMIETEDSAILVRAAPGVTLQRLTDVITRLNAAGFRNLVLVE